MPRFNKAGHLVSGRLFITSHVVCLGGGRGFAGRAGRVWGWLGAAESVAGVGSVDSSDVGGLGGRAGAAVVGPATGGIKTFAEFTKEQAEQIAQKLKGKRTPRPMNMLTDPQAMLDEALYRQGKKSGDPYPGGYKEKWSENGYDHEVRVHQPPPKAPAGSNSSKGPTYRVARKKQGLDPSSPGGKGGYGWEYIDENGNWHKERDLKAGTDPTANNSTHIPLPNGTIK